MVSSSFIKPYLSCSLYLFYFSYIYFTLRGVLMGGGGERVCCKIPICRNCGYRFSSAKSKIKIELDTVGRGLAPAASIQRLHRRELDVPSYLCFAVIPRSLRRGIRSLAALGAARCYASQRSGLPRQFANWLAIITRFHTAINEKTTNARCHSEPARAWESPE